MISETSIEMAGLPLTPGTYRLSREVSNPRADGRIKQRRASNWESWKSWPEGMEFIVDIEPRGQGAEEEIRERFGVMISGKRDNRIYVWGGFYKVDRHDARFPALIDALEPVKESPSKYLARLGLGSGAGTQALAVLDELDIPIERIQAALDAIEAREFAEDVSQEASRGRE